MRWLRLQADVRRDVRLLEWGGYYFCEAFAAGGLKGRIGGVGVADIEGNALDHLVRMAAAPGTLASMPMSSASSVRALTAMVVSANCWNSALSQASL